MQQGMEREMERGWKEGKEVTHPVLLLISSADAINSSENTVNTALLLKHAFRTVQPLTC
jgi:hypothetical protein